MKLYVKMLTVCGLIGILHLWSASASTETLPHFMNSLQTFNQYLLSGLIPNPEHKSVIYSPFSIQSSLAMIRLGADGQTADELDKGLGFVGQTAESVADNYHTLLSKYENSNFLKVANKVYVKKSSELSDTYQNQLSSKFYTTAENIDFSQKEAAAKTINNWIKSKTNNAINELIKADSLGSDVGLVLLSAIHFNGQWADAFKKEDTKEKPFYIGDLLNGDLTSVPVQMMFKRAYFKYGYQEELMADVVILPYKDSDLSMVLLLNRRGFDKMLNSLKTFDWQSVKNNNQIRLLEGSIQLPKFKTEFEIKLNDILIKKGIKKMFGDADFTSMLKSSDDLSVSEVVHKATIEVTEEGTTASAATGNVAKSRNSIQAVFNRPFAYAIVNEDYVPLFVGTFTGR